MNLRVTCLCAALVPALLCVAASARADIVIEGQVALPPARAAAVNLRYQQISGEVAAPDAPAAIVYLEGAGAGGAKPEPGTVAQKGYQFSPGLMAVEAGAQITFANQDDDYHHVFSYSKTKSFDLGRYRKDEAAPVVTFETPGTVTVGCEIHDHMRGTILVLESHYFVKTAADGSYRLVLPDSVAGKFTLKAWLNDRKVFGQPVDLVAGATVKADFPAP
jgi:plastocyanin